MDYLDMYELQRHYSQGGGHWFEPGSLRFFQCRLPQTAYVGPGGIFFVSSEQFVGRNWVRHPRKFTVRTYNPFTRKIDTAGEFQQYASRCGADRAARRYAEKGAA